MWDPHKKRRGSSSDKAKTTIPLDFLFQRSTHLSSQKTQRAERLLNTFTAALTRSPITLRDIYDGTWSGKIACTHHTIAVNTKQIPGRYCKDELTTSRYYIGVTSFVHFLHDQTQSRTEKQMNTEQYSTKPIIQILSSDSESSKWILDYDMWHGSPIFRKAEVLPGCLIHSTCFTRCHWKSSLRFSWNVANFKLYLARRHKFSF